MIVDVLHFSFTVSSIEAAVRWYTEILGLTLVHRQRSDNEYTRTLVGMPEAVLEVAQFKLPTEDSPYSTHMLELIEYVEPAGEHHRLPMNNVGAPHLGFVVTDIHERYERMLSQGVVFVNPPVRITEGANAGGWACYLRDPDGITLELLQFGPERAARLGLPQETA